MSARRLFLALDLPAETAAELSRWTGQLVGARDGLRPIPTESLHVTLVFLGSTTAEVAHRVVSVAGEASAAHVSPRLVPKGVAWVPARGPRLLAMELGDCQGGTAALAGSLGASLSEAGLHEPESRAFWPHVTLARAKRGQAPRAEGRPPLPEAFEARSVTLYESHPGSRYTALRSWQLGQRTGRGGA